jgi:predicted TIM-barrel fold metal-dependent hydrolase
MTSRSASDLRAQLGHPVVDSDGHILEMAPVICEFIHDEGGQDAVDRYGKATEGFRRDWGGKKPLLSLDERVDSWTGKSSWWSNTANTFDRATAMLPGLLIERLGELGIDFAVLYPSEGLAANRIEGDDDLRRIACRAVNRYQAELYAGCERFVTGVAVIPMGTPQEAIEELDHAASLGFKTAMFSSGVRRPVAKHVLEHADVAHLLERLDFYGIDSPYDYDEVWRRCEELGLPVTFHGMWVGSSNGPVSPTSLPFNRLAGINAYPALCAALMLGGAVKRFPGVNFAFQECGVGWACDLFGQLLGLWEKRSSRHISEYNPANLDIAQLQDLVTRYGNERARRQVAWLKELATDLVEPETLDEFERMGAQSAEDVRSMFTEAFYFGCEADDAMNARAFSGNPLNAELKITFGSDIGHWDVPDVNHVLAEAFELVEDGLVDLDQFRRFTCDNAIEMFTSMNPTCFAGTTVEEYAAGSRTRASA